MSITYFPPNPAAAALLQFPNGAWLQDGYTTLTTTIPNPTSTAAIVVGSTTGFLSAGALLIDSELGRGSRFSLRLPAARVRLRRIVDTPRPQSSAQSVDAPVS